MWLNCPTIICSVTVSVLTIRGTECGLIELGQVANITGGEVKHICFYIEQQ